MAVSAALSVKVRPFKQTKRHIAAKGVEKFAKLPERKVGLNEEFDGPFRSNIRLFLMKYGWEVPLPPVLHREVMLPCLMTWRVVLELACMDVVMHVIEEDVRRSRSVYCENCRVAGQ